MMMSMTPPAVVETLKVSGASLYYEKRGSGPVLLMIPGGSPRTCLAAAAGRRSDWPWPCGIPSRCACWWRTSRRPWSY